MFIKLLAVLPLVPHVLESLKPLQSTGALGHRKIFVIFQWSCLTLAGVSLVMTLFGYVTSTASFFLFGAILLPVAMSTSYFIRRYIIDSQLKEQADKLVETVSKLVKTVDQRKEAVETFGEVSKRDATLSHETIDICKDHENLLSDHSKSLNSLLDAMQSSLKATTPLESISETIESFPSTLNEKIASNRTFIEAIKNSIERTLASTISEKEKGDRLVENYQNLYAESSTVADDSEKVMKNSSEGLIQFRASLDRFKDNKTAIFKLLKPFETYPSILRREAKELKAIRLHLEYSTAKLDLNIENAHGNWAF